MDATEALHNLRSAINARQDSELTELLGALDEACRTSKLPDAWATLPKPKASDIGKPEWTLDRARRLLERIGRNQDKSSFLGEHHHPHLCYEFVGIFVGLDHAMLAGRGPIEWSDPAVAKAKELAAEFAGGAR